MRLIDADRLYNERPEYLNPVREGREEYNKGWNACVEMFCKLIDNQPTAFDTSEKDNAIDIIEQELNGEE